MPVLRAAVRSLFLAGALVAFAAIVGAGAAHADQVVLKNGETLEAADVKVLEKSLVVTVKVTGGTATYTFAFDRIDPISLVALLDSKTPADDAAGQARLARVALDAGLRDEAALRIARAAEKDPTLVPLRDEMLAKIQGLEIADAVAEVERRVRAGEWKGALVLADALLSAPLGQGPSPEQALRIETLAELARTLLAKEAAPPAGPLPPAPPNPPKPVPPGPVDPALAEAGALEERAGAARDAAADPKLHPADAIRHLEVAADALLHARRLLAKVPAPHPADVTARLGDVRALLTATWLDLADLLRQMGEFDAALDRVRAALILDPGNERAWEIRRWIEEDLRPPNPPLEDPYFSPFSPAFSPWEPAIRRYTYRTFWFGGYEPAYVVPFPIYPGQPGGHVVHVRGARR